MFSSNQSCLLFLCCFDRKELWYRKPKPQLASNLAKNSHFGLPLPPREKRESSDDGQGHTFLDNFQAIKVACSDLAEITPPEVRKRDRVLMQREALHAAEYKHTPI